MEKYYDMSKYPIYKVDMIEGNDSEGVNVEQSKWIELLNDSLDDSKSLLDSNKELRSYCKQLMEICKGQSERIKRNNRSAILMDRFIFDKVDHDEWVSYLKNLKLDPEYKDYIDEIETHLTEYGADEETEKWLQEQIDKEGNNG